MVNKYLIDRIDVKKNRLEVFASKDFKKKWLLDDFFVEYDADVDLNRIDTSIVQIPFILNVIPIIWLSREIYHIESLDGGLARSLNEVREAFCEKYPNLEWTGQLIPDKLVSNITYNNNGTKDKCGVLFSGGVDSVCTSFRHMNKRQVLITIWGANVALENKAGWEVVMNQSKQFGQLYGQDNAFIKSNFKRFLYTSKLKTFSNIIPRWWSYIQYGLGLTGLTAPILMERGCSQLFIASSHSQGYQGGKSASDYSIDNKLYWDGVSIVYDAHELSRQAKVQTIKKFSETRQKPLLNVCFSDVQKMGDNCCRCEKCLRTITGLLLEREQIRDYGFDISVNKVLALIKDKFISGSMELDESAASFWKDLQARAQEVISSSYDKGSKEDNLIEFFTWFESVNLEEYRIQYEKNSKPPYVVHFLKGRMKKLLSYFPIVGRPLQKKIEQYHYRKALK